METKNGNKREYEYENNELKRITFASGQYFDFTFSEGKITEIRDNLNRCIEYKYNGDYLISVKIPNGGIEKYTYNEQGLISEVTNADGVTFVQNKYDEKDRIIYQKLPTG